MARGNFTAHPQFCPMCGATTPRDGSEPNAEQFGYITQGNGSGEYEVVCLRCGWDGHVDSYADCKRRPDLLHLEEPIP